MLRVRHEHTLLVLNGPKSTLSALQRDEDEWEWHETHRLQANFNHLCALSGGRVLCVNIFHTGVKMPNGERIIRDDDDTFSNQMMLYRVESGGRIVLVHNIQSSVRFNWFAATTRGSDALVATSIKREIVLHRLVGSQLEELWRVSNLSYGLGIWIGDTMISKVIKQENSGSEELVALKFTGTELILSRRLPIDQPEKISIGCFCVIGDQIALFDLFSCQLLVYAFPSNSAIRNYFI